MKIRVNGEERLIQCNKNISLYEAMKLLGYSSNTVVVEVNKLIINSEDRDRYLYPNSNNYVINLNKTYSDVVEIELISIVFMLLGSLPFVLYLKVLRGNLRALWRDSQVQWFFTIVITAVGALAIYLWHTKGKDPVAAVSNSAFNVVSVITGTGYSTTDFSAWGPFALASFLFLMFTSVVLRWSPFIDTFSPLSSKV